MALRLNGSNTGYVELDVPADAGSHTLTLPDGGGSSGQYLQTNGSGGLSWQTVANVSTAKVVDAKSSGTNGGTFTLGADRTRDLNAKEDPDNIVTLSNNQFTLGAGTYLIQWTCPAFRVGRHQSHLYNVTDTAIQARGQSSQASNADTGESLSSGYFIATITGDTVYEIRHRCSDTVTSNGFGHQCGFGTEIFTQVTIFKLS